MTAYIAPVRRNTMSYTHHPAKFDRVTLSSCPPFCEVKPVAHRSDASVRPASQGCLLTTAKSCSKQHMLWHMQQSYLVRHTLLHASSHTSLPTAAKNKLSASMLSSSRTPLLLERNRRVHGHMIGWTIAPGGPLSPPSRTCILRGWDACISSP